MIDELIELLRRELSAMEQVEARVRAVELLAAGGQARFVTLALDELDTASERLAALEVGRTLHVMGAGLSEDTTAAELVARHDDEDGRLAAVVEDLRATAQRVADARQRAERAVAAANVEVVDRIELGAALAG